MADEDEESKTEEPSERKLQKAREEGQVAQSTEVRTLVSLMGLLTIVAFLAPWSVRRIGDVLRGIFQNLFDLSLDVHSVQELLFTIIIDICIILAPAIGLLSLLALIGNIAQVGFLYNPKKIMPKLSNFSPKNGLKKIASFAQVLELIKGIIKIIIVSIISFFVLRPMFNHPDVYSQQNVLESLNDLYFMMIMMIFAVVAAFIVVAVADWFWQKFRLLRQLKMTKQELKDEYKQQDGDPLIKSKIRQLRSRRARERIAQAVPKASVVVTNPTHFAVALAYEMETMAAPRCVAKGADFLARKIRDVAEEHDVPIVENPPLARALYATVEVDQEIPGEHYKAVAEVIGYVMRLKRKKLPPKRGRVD